MLTRPKISRYAAIGLMGLLLLVVIATFTDYGITWDEELQSQYGQAIADYYVSGFKDMRFTQIYNLYLYGGTFDGLAALINAHMPLIVYDVRHLLNALFGLLGLWGTWRLGRFIGGDFAGLVALILCACAPSYYGHMFNNPKDIPFAAGIVWTLYFMSRSYAKPDRITLTKLAVVLGMTLGVRVGGVMVFAFWLVPLGVATLLPLREGITKDTLKSISYDIWTKFWRLILPVGLLSYAVMLVFWPWAQQAPIANPLKALGEFSNFPQDVEVLLQGQTYLSTDLPWYYVPLYFGIQLPELLLFLLAAAFMFFPRLWRTFTLPQRQSFALLLMMMSFPVIYAVIAHPALYDTVRHFTFAVPLACIVAALGARELAGAALSLKNAAAGKWAAAVLGVAFAALIGYQAVLMERLHPYEYIYANRFAGGVGGAFGRYETDYWGSSFKEAAQKIQEYVAAEGGIPPGKIYEIAICGPWDAALIYLPPNFKPVPANEPAEFFLSTTRWKCQDMRPGKEIARIERMGVPLSVVKDLRRGYAYYKGNMHLKK